MEQTLGSKYKIPIVAQLIPSKLDSFNRMAFRGKEGEFKKLAECYKEISEVSLSEFMDANSIIINNGTDGVHPLPVQYEILGKAIDEKVKELKI